MASVVLRPNESQDQLLKRFRKKVVKSGVLSTVRRKRWFISKSENDRVEHKKALRRLQRRSIDGVMGMTMSGSKNSKDREGGKDRDRDGGRMNRDF